MGTLLKLEWLKIRKYRAFIVLLAFFIVSVFGINYMGFSAVAERAAGVETEVMNMLIGGVFDFPQVWQTVSYLSSFLLFIPGLLVIMLMANEYSFRTCRQSVINGVSRSQFIDTKIVLIFIFALILTLLVFLTAAVFGLAGSTSFSFGGLEYIGYFFVQAVSYMSVALVLAILLKRSGVGIGIYFLYGFIVENLLAVIINKKILDGAGRFLPLESSDKLIPAPSMFGKALISKTYIDPLWLLAAACVWIAVCLLFCKYRFKKSDL